MAAPMADTAAAAGSDTVLEVEHVSMRFGGLLAVSDLSFKAARGEITALIGPNGAGKTTVFNCITGFYKPTSGRIVLARGGPASPQDVARLTATGARSLRTANGAIYQLERMPDYEITAQAKVARTFQNIRLFSGMTVLENLIVAQHNALMRASGYTVRALFGSRAYARAEAEAVERAKAWLERLGLTHRADDAAGALPYGDQRRLEIARAMCTEPALLCLDEPAAGLNPRESAELKGLIRALATDYGASVLLIEHDMSVVMEISDRVVVLEYGIKIADGTPDAVRNDPRVIAAYLGVEDEEVAAVEAEIGA